MRLSSFHVDGFGALSDFGFEDLGSGLVVLLGPNEAGKSTLFDFFAGVLFGFPNRKDNPHFHAPVRGGRHGGRVGFLDEAGAAWSVERYASPHRALRVQHPDGSEGDERSLSRALAGASSSLFRTVFAVGLDDLGRMEQLESDEVRELLFAASIFGQRHSATRAMRQLMDARDELARPRRDDATANRLARQLESVRSDLAVARHEAAAYEQLQRQAGRVDDEVRRIRSALLRLRSRERELQLLERAWHPYRKITMATSELDAFPEPGPGSDLLAHETEIRSLAAEHSGHFERVVKLDELKVSARRLGRSIEATLASLGEGWTAERARSTVEPLLLADTARGAFARLGELRTELVSAEAVLDQADSLLLTARRAESAAAGALLQPVPTTGELRQRSEAVEELKERMAELERWELERLAVEREAANPTPVVLVPRGSTRLASTALALAGLVVAGLGVGLLGRGLGAIAPAAVVLGLLLVVFGGVLELSSRRPTVARELTKAGAVGAAPAGAATTAARLDAAAANDRADRMAFIERIRTRVDILAAALGLDAPPSRVDVDRCAAALQRQREERRTLDDRAATRSEAEARVAAAREAREAALQALAAAEGQHEAWCSRNGLPRSGPAETLEAIASVSDVHDKLEALDRVAKAVAEIESSVGAFARRCEVLFGCLTPEDAGPSGWQDTDDAAVSAARLTTLVNRLDACLALEARRSELQRGLQLAIDELDDALGGGEEGERLGQELATGSHLKWATERQEMQPSIDDLQKAEEAAVRQHQSTAEARAQIAGSGRIAELEQRESELTVELDVALRRYLVLGTARSLLQMTLARHERERQPAVIAKASAHFARVTGGRYTGLVADSGLDGKRTIRVLSAKGEALDAASLSRGTVEQLYLCLRFGLADCFAERSVSLPVVLDDVLVNFDPERARAVATELAASARSHQIILMTCHPHLAEVALRASSEGPTPPQLIELGRVA